MSTMTLSAEQLKARVRQLFEELDKKKILSVDELGNWFTPDLVVHQGGSGAEIKGLEAWKQYMKGSFTTFPDLHFTIEDMVAEGDKVAFR